MLTRARGLLVIALLSSCAQEDEPLAPDADPEPLPSETLIAGDSVVTTTGRDGEYFTTVVERGQLVFTLATDRRSDGETYGFTAVMHLPDHVRRHAFELGIGATAEEPQLEGVSRTALFQLGLLRKDIAIENGLPVPQDRAGCDGMVGECSIYGGCCDHHDKCFADNECTGGLLSTDSVECVACNATVIGCFVGGTFWCGTKWLFGGGCKSECCDQGPLGNICGAECSDATPGAWYLWGNHGCTENVLVNYFCVQNLDALPGCDQSCYKYDGRTGTYAVVADTEFVCDACGQDGYCNESTYCTTCPEELDPACNPPIYTPGSYMDQICNAPELTQVCGDDVCNGLESCSSCRDDCGVCPGSEHCGDGACNNGETCSSCADCGDCAVEHCGDNACGNGEDCQSCAQDCGACSVCGNEVCDGYPEDCGTCPGDCPCADGTTCEDRQCVSYCGNDVCDPGETCTACAQDCGACPTCGDGACNYGEDCTTCPGDCDTLAIATQKYSDATAYGVLVTSDLCSTSPTWVTANAGLSGGALSIRNLALDPIGGEIAWAATWDGGWVNPSLWSGGTWQQVLNKAQFEAAAGRSFPTGWDVMQLVPSPTVPGRVHGLVQGNDSSQPIESRYRYYAVLSTNYGTSWSAVQVGQTGSSIANGASTGPSVSIFPSLDDPAKVWLSSFSSKFAGCVYFANCTTLWASGDGGATWQEQLGWRFGYTRTTHPKVAPGNAHGYRTREPVGSSDPAFEATGDGFTSSARAVSLNPFVQVGLSWANYARRANSLVVDRFDDNKVALLSSGYTLTSSNGGATWQRRTDTFGNGHVGGAGASHQSLLAATSYRWLYNPGTEAIKFSPDFGVTWVNKTGNLLTHVTAQYKYVSITALIPHP